MTLPKGEEPLKGSELITNYYARVDPHGESSEFMVEFRV